MSSIKIKYLNKFSQVLKKYRLVLAQIIVLSGIVLLSGCNRSARTFFQEGVSHELAKYRSKQIYDVVYQLHFSIPADKLTPVTGKAIINFKPLKARHGLILDFTPGSQNVHSVTVNGDSTYYLVDHGHIYIDANQLVPRQNNSVEISFTASDQALNRSDDFMYTLFVPDRASTAFPCFDQPDIKATFILSLDIPQSWSALSNGSMVKRESKSSFHTLHFAGDKPISTYLFAFTAGIFDTISKTRNDRTITLFHRETDSLKLAQNVESIFSHHFDALQWLEEYTGIPYPYSKLDMALLPGFQYSGMEHPGAIWYRDTRLLIDTNAPVSTIIRKANLIAHEASHMWFGNLVTMKWFDDVWLKEVFAGFMADKIVAVQFPDFDHKLQFMLSHYPKAMAVDRSEGSHPIKQQLANLKLAGTLYGAIIYNKAPIVFEQLEQLMTPNAFRQSVTEYLTRFSHANADWTDLVTIFGKYSSENINEWSNAWVFQSGLPQIETTLSTETSQPGLTILQPNTSSGEVFGSQWLKGVFLSTNNIQKDSLWFTQNYMQFNPSSETKQGTLFVPNGAGMGYGYFKMSESELKQATQNDLITEDAVLRAALYINIFENLLHGNLSNASFSELWLTAIAKENDPSLINYLLGNLQVWARQFPAFPSDTTLQSQTEQLLFEKMATTSTPVASLFFDAWVAVVRSAEMQSRMEEIYYGEIKVGNLALSDDQLTQLALEILVRNPGNTKIAEIESQRLANPDRNRRFHFILPALSANEAERDQFFESLSNPANRRPEPWVLDALYFLHHPTRNEQGMKYIAKSMDMLVEIQRTGDIFFPLNWLEATLLNYHQPEVEELVNDYLLANPELEITLKNKVLQAVDILKRSVDSRESDQISSISCSDFSLARREIPMEIS